MVRKQRLRRGQTTPSVSSRPAGETGGRARRQAEREAGVKSGTFRLAGQGPNKFTTSSVSQSRDEARGRIAQADRQFFDETGQPLEGRIAGAGRVLPPLQQPQPPTQTEETLQQSLLPEFRDLPPEQALNQSVAGVPQPVPTRFEGAVQGVVDRLFSQIPGLRQFDESGRTQGQSVIDAFREVFNLGLASSAATGAASPGVAALQEIRAAEGAAAVSRGNSVSRAAAILREAIDNPRVPFRGKVTELASIPGKVPPQPNNFNAAGNFIQNSANVKRVQRWYNNFLSPQTLKTIRNTALGSAVASWFLGLWARAETPEPFTIVEREAINQARTTGDFSVVEEIRAARDDVVSTNTLQNILTWVPGAGAFIWIPRKFKANVKSGLVLNAISDDWEEYLDNNESPEERSDRIAREIADAATLRNEEKKSNELEILKIKGEYFRILEEEGSESAERYLDRELDKINGE